MKIIGIGILMVLVGCSSKVDSNKKVAGDFLELALSSNPLNAQELTHPEFKFVFMGNTEISNIPYDQMHTSITGFRSFGNAPNWNQFNNYRYDCR